jgi:hypothetical protein
MDPPPLQPKNRTADRFRSLLQFQDRPADAKKPEGDPNDQDVFRSKLLGCRLPRIRHRTPLGSRAIGRRVQIHRAENGPCRRIYAQGRNGCSRLRSGRAGDGDPEADGTACECRQVQHSASRWDTVGSQEHQPDASESECGSENGAKRRRGSCSQKISLSRRRIHGDCERQDDNRRVRRQVGSPL